MRQQQVGRRRRGWVCKGVAVSRTRSQVNQVACSHVAHADLQHTVVTCLQLLPVSALFSTSVKRNADATKGHESNPVHR